MRRAFLFGWVSAGLFAASLASPFGAGAQAASAADANVDLTDCLAPPVTAGDVRVFDTNQGEQLTETVLAVAGGKSNRGLATTVRAQLGTLPPTVRETLVKPGRRVMLGDLEVGDLTIAVGKPERWVPLTATPRKTYRAHVEGDALRGGKRVGRAVVKSDWEVVGFEPLETPSGSYPDTVHIAVTRDLEVRYRKGARVAQESDVELWCVDGVGVVAARYAFRFYKNGKLVDEIGGLDSWLVSATVGGAAVN